MWQRERNRPPATKPSLSPALALPLLSESLESDVVITRGRE